MHKGYQLILGIETSCDDTAAALVWDGKELSSSVHSQLVHSPYGGVVPELASREHIAKILPVVRNTLEQGKVELKQLGGVAVTAGPGLPGSILIGLSFAKALAYSLDIPIIGVNHLEGHLFGAFAGEEPPVPFIGLVVSGGHSHIYLSETPGRYSLLGRTRDDAAGECFDKIARFMGFPYPGGPEIEKLAAEGNPNAIKLPVAMKNDDSLDMSFSGIKTAALIKLKKNKEKQQNNDDKHSRSFYADLAYALQKAVVDTVVLKIRRAIEKTGVKRVVAGGGVVANSYLRERLTSLAEGGMDVRLAPARLASDNGVVTALAGEYRLKQGERSDWSLTALSRMPLEESGG